MVKIKHPFAYVFVYIALHVFFHFNFVAFCFYHMHIHSCIVKEHPSIFSSLFLFNILPSCLLYTFFSQLSNHSCTFDSDNASDLHRSLCFYSPYIFLRIHSEERCIFQVPDLPQQSTWRIYIKQSHFLLKLLLLSQAKIVLDLNRNCPGALNSFRNKSVMYKWRLMSFQKADVLKHFFHPWGEMSSLFLRENDPYSKEKLCSFWH